MWLLVVTVIYFVGAEPHQQQFSSRDPIASQADCMARGREAVDRMSRINGVAGIGFTCRELPTI